MVTEYRDHHTIGRHGDNTNGAKNGAGKKICSTRLITHHFKLDQILDAYDTFERAPDTKALKVIIETNA
jgi:threonine dehydrogenase-like Zn-dependent dehydrogenase